MVATTSFFSCNAESEQERFEYMPDDFLPAAHYTKVFPSCPKPPANEVNFCTGGFTGADDAVCSALCGWYDDCSDL